MRHLKTIPSTPLNLLLAAVASAAVGLLVANGMVLAARVYFGIG